MPGAIYKLAVEKVTHSKSKGKKFINELNAALGPAAICKKPVETSGKKRK